MLHVIKVYFTQWLRADTSNTRDIGQRITPPTENKAP